MAPSPGLRPSINNTLGVRLESLLGATSPEARLLADPIVFPRRYTQLDDIEVAAVFASGLAFGRVASFTPVIAAILDQADAHGGPAAWVDGFSAAHASPLAPLRYRWMDGADFALLAATLGEFRRGDVSLGQALTDLDDPTHATIGDALDGLILALRRCAMTVAQVDEWSALPRGFRYFLPRPTGGSACKRWCMMLRWMVRRPGPGAAGIDMGVWSDISPSRLVMPLDTHVHRLGRLLGLTRRKDASWKTALDITASLRTLSPEDPLRHDFALAHLGISGTCRGTWHEDVCTPCPLRPVCTEGSGPPIP